MSGSPAGLRAVISSVTLGGEIFSQTGGMTPVRLQMKCLPAAQVWAPHIDWGMKRSGGDVVYFGGEHMLVRISLRLE